MGFRETSSYSTGPRSSPVISKVISRLGRIRGLRRHIGGDFRPFGRVEHLDGTPRGDCAHCNHSPRGPRRAHIDYIRRFPEPFQLLFPAFRPSIDGRKHATFARFGAM